MEDFLKSKMDQLESNFQDDWNAFEQKLERALFFKRLRIGAALSVFLIATSIGIFGTSSIITFERAEQWPFGVLTDEGYQGSGSQSSWGNDHNSEDADHSGNSISNAFDSGEENTNDRASADVESATNDIAHLNTQSATTPSVASAATIQPSHDNTTSSDNVVASSTTSSFPSVGDISNDIDQSSTVYSSSDSKTIASGQKVASEDAVQTLASETNNGSVGTIAVSAQTTSGDGLVANNGPQSQTLATVALGAENTPPIDQTPVVADASSSNSGSNGLALVSNDTDAEKPLEVLRGKPLKLNVPTLAALGGNSLEGLQVRPPIPSKAPAVIKKAGPYISSLQGNSLWEYYLKVYPNFTFRKFKVDQDKQNFIHRDFVDQVQVSESGGFSLNIGLEVSRRIGPATYLKGGLEYISYNHSANFDFTNFRTANIDDATGAITSYTLLDEPEDVLINDKNTYHYINLPLNISYQPWASEHIRLNMEAGVSYMYFVAANGQSLDYRTLEIIDLSEREFKNSLGSVNLKVGATYYISPQFNLGFEPTFVYFTNTIYTDEYPFEVIPYSVGLNFKLQVKLN